MIFSPTVSATLPTFSNLNLSPTGTISDNVEDRGINQIDVKQPVNLIVTVDGDTQNEKVTTLSSSLSAPTVSNLSISGTGTISGKVNDADFPNQDLLVKLTIDDNPANRERVGQGTVFNLQAPAPFLDDQSHNFVVTVHDANLPGVSSSSSIMEYRVTMLY